LHLGLVINQAIDAKEAAGVHTRIASVAQRFLGYTLPLIGWVPRDDRVSDSVRKRRPLLLEHPRSPAARGVRQLSEQVLSILLPAGVDPPRKSEGLSDLFARLILRGR
jgi:flagellar biosynthesis protein FlhG